MAFDALGILPGMFTTTVYIDVNVTGHLTGYDFIFVAGNATIEGTVSNENSAPVEGITVFARQEGPTSAWDVTDINGFYQLAVIEGTWYIDFNPEELMPDYMRPQDAEVEILEGNTETVDIMLYETDSFIEGTVYLDGVPTQGFEIQAWNDVIGDSRITSSANGTYDLPVASEANPLGGYNVDLDIWNIPGFYVDEYYQLFLPNGTYEVSAQGDMYYQEYIDDVVINNNYINIDFYLDPISFAGSLEGTVVEEGTTNPITYADISVYNNNYWTGTTTDENGYYYLDMPDGTFSLNAWHQLYYGVFLSDIVINNNAVFLDFEMEPIVFDGALEGYVYEENTTNPVTYANIEVNGNYWTSTMSDATGFYHVDLPNGFYSLDCWKNGYIGANINDIEINNNTVEQDVYLIPEVKADELLNYDLVSIANYPNPFNPTTAISFNLATEIPQVTELVIYNMKGQKVKQLISDQLSAGQHTVYWNGTDDHDKPVSSGIYFYKLKSGDDQQIRKMLLMK